MSLPKNFIDYLIKIWTDISENDCPNWKEVKVRELSTTGSTSRQYLILVPLMPEGEKHIFVKQYITQEHNREFWETQLRNEFEVTKFISEKLADPGYIKVLQPYCMVQEKLLFVTGFVTGENLGYLFSHALRFSKLPFISYKKLHNFVRAAGTGLAKLQEINADDFVPMFGKTDLAAYLEGILTRFEKDALYLENAGYFPDLIKRGRKTLYGIISKIDMTEKMCFQHTDFMLHNLLVDRLDQLVLFDFPNARFGLPHFDIAHFISALEDFSYLRMVSKKHVTSLIQSFLTALGARCRLTPGLLDVFRIYFQFVSTVIILKRDSCRSNFLRRVMHENTLDRFRNNISKLLTNISEGNNDLNLITGDKNMHLFCKV